MQKYKLLTAFLLSSTLFFSAFADTAYFAGGCFWCMEADFEKLHGVTDVISGYMGGSGAHPTYESVSKGKSGFVEMVKVDFDPKIVSYNKLLDYYWRHVDPTDGKGQFCDKGPQYTTVIFYTNPAQRNAALKSKEGLEKTKRFNAPIVTRIAPANHFYPAEKYHQDFYKRHSLKYRYYRLHCGRDDRLLKLWGDNTLPKVPKILKNSSSKPG